MKTQPSDGTLTRAQVEFYRREGYLIYDQPVLPSAEFDKLAKHFDAKLASLPVGERPENMDVPHFADPALFEWLFADEILDLVGSLIGPDIALFSSHFICKPKGNGKRVPWHQDSAYWRGMINPMEVVTVWLAIDQSTEENGCMRVVPRTQRGPDAETVPVDLATNVFNTEIKRQVFDASTGVPCMLEPNHCSLHDARLIHGSEPNLSIKRRCGYTMRYMSTRVRFNHEAVGDWHRIYLARGRDYAGNHYGNPTRADTEFLQHRIKVGKTGH
ncbi:MAG: phytanoyl-CoA dioxygenase family protein [Verrucomicrobiia bacterium]